MDAIDILGSLLGRKAGRPGKGTDVLKDIFKRQPRSADSRSTASPDLQPGDIQRHAQELEDLLNVANERDSRRRTGQPRQSTGQPRRDAPQPDADFRRDDLIARRRDWSSDVEQHEVIRRDERALLIVRAMVNAAKADGQLSQSEQDAILERVDDRSRDTMQFLREEFARPLDVREFAWSVPIGMEQQVYTMSLITIDLDTRREATYLHELAHGLRIPEQIRDQIHDRLGAPRLS